MISFGSLEELFSCACSPSPEKDGYKILEIYLNNNPELSSIFGKMEVTTGYLEISVKVFKDGYIYEGIALKGGDVILSDEGQLLTCGDI